MWDSLLQELPEVGDAGDSLLQELPEVGDVGFSAARAARGG